MVYLAIVFLCSILLGIGIMLLKAPFFGLANTTMAMLNVILENEVDDSIKQKKLIKNLGGLLKAFLLILIAIGIMLFVSSLPLLMFGGFDEEKLGAYDYTSWQFFLAITLGSLLMIVRIHRHEH